MRNSTALLAWASVLLIGAAGASLTAKVGVDGAASDPIVERSLEAASRLALPAKIEASSLALADARLAVWRPRDRRAPIDAADEADAPPRPAEKLLRVAMLAAPMIAPASANRTRRLGALSALEAALPAPDRAGGEFSAYGELAPDIFATRRLTILQLGDSHTAADYFTGRVRERLQQLFGSGGMAYIVPGKPHLGVRSALFESDASDGWTYETLQKSDETRRFYLSGFNAVARHAGASLSLRARGGLAYDRLEVAFLKQPGGGRAEVLVDGEPGGQIDLDGAADQRATLDLQAPPTGAGGFHDIAVRALSDAPVTVTGVEVAREGDGVSYISLGFPGATVQLLQKLAAENLADELRRLAPDIVVLAFGTNEGFNDALDVGAYTAQYERIVGKLQELRPGLRIVIIGPPDGARSAGVCRDSAAGRDCPAPAPPSAALEGGAQCRLPTPPKLAQVREAQRRLAERVGADFWDWSSVMPGPCGAQVWAAADPPLMAHDYVHMTTEGYKKSADRFADFLIPLIDGRQTDAHVVSNN
ncbi:MAG: GDSL-type esterase/lipase family protein [Roseiarcus sp.]